MTEFANLIRWVIAYAVSGGFWHFLGVWIIVSLLVRMLWFVRVGIKITRKARKEPK